MLITAVDARTGDPVVFDRYSGVDLVDAVAASTSSGPPYRIGDNRYIDGGYRRNENARSGGRMRTGAGAVTIRRQVSAPAGVGHAARSAGRRTTRNAGSRVETIFPDGNSRDAFGGNMMDLSTRPPAARAGHDQGRALAEQLADFWR